MLQLRIKIKHFEQSIYPIKKTYEVYGKSLVFLLLSVQKYQNYTMPKQANPFLD